MRSLLKRGHPPALLKKVHHCRNGRLQICTFLPGLIRCCSASKVSQTVTIVPKGIHYPGNGRDGTNICRGLDNRTQFGWAEKALKGIPSGKSTIAESYSRYL